MKYIVKDSQNKMMTMEVVSSMPQLPEGWQVVGKPEDHPEVVAEMAAGDSKSAQILAAYNQMNSEVYAEMAVVFGTTNAESAQAYNETFRLMKESPADFVGATFASEAAVTAYADIKLNRIKQYAVWRLARIQAFQTLKATILAS